MINSKGIAPTRNETAQEQLEERSEKFAEIAKTSYVLM